MNKIAFNTANLVARFSGYRFSLSTWGEQDRLTRQKTDEKEFAAICREIAVAGFRAVEIWAAHVDAAQMTDQRAKAYRAILDDCGLLPIGLAGGLNDDTARVCRQLGITSCNGGMWGSDLSILRRLTGSAGIKFNYENHPEKSVAEIRQKIAGGGEGVGVCIDTGWLGTQAVDAPAAINELGKLVGHVHIKDVKAHGKHETCPLGQGVVNIAAVIAALKNINYSGWYSWEDEPEDRNPMDIAAEMRLWMEKQLQL